MLFLEGRKFGKLTAIRRSGRRRKGYYEWECLCECGNTTYLTTYQLKHQKVRSCGCTSYKILSLTGRRFGKLTALQNVGLDKEHSCLWLCKCDCGNEVVVPTRKLTSGNNKSCGCLRASKNQAVEIEPGTRFGHLTVIENGKNWQCQCQCDCGNTVTIRKYDLIRTDGRDRTSCGKKCTAKKKTSLGLA